MFKDYDKYLSASLKVYLFVLVAIFIMKIVGLDYFGLNINDSVFTRIFMFLAKYKIDYIIQNMFLFLNFYLIKSIILKKYKFDFEAILIPLIIMIGTYFLYKFDLKQFYSLYNTLVMFIYFLIKKIKIKRIIKVFLINILIQFISSIIRNYDIQNYKTLINLIMNIDYYIMLIIWYKIEKQGGEEQWEIGQEVYSYLQKKMNLKNLLTKLQKNLLNFKKKSKEEKLTIIIYLLLSLIWNVGTVLLVLIISQLNHTFIECIFILTSFWISKRNFGKAFHLNSMIQCFVVSNLTYYILNRITTPLGISIFVPILLGVGLSYFTSKLVKKTYKPLYKGISKDVFEETILKIVDKDSMKYKICYDFYIEGKSDLSLSFKYNYSIAGIRKIRTRINDKIKEL